MPVEFDEYERSEGDVVREGSNAHAVLAFLYDHPETGFTPSEIAETTGIPEGSVGPTLQRLRERDLVRHKEPYWAIGTDERLASFEAMLRGMETLHERYGDEGWADVDREDHEVGGEELAAWRREHGDT